MSIYNYGSYQCLRQRCKQTRYFKLVNHDSIKGVKALKNGPGLRYRYSSRV